MRKIKTFKLFESNNIPSNYILLDNIGAYLNPYEGVTYPILDDGSIDEEELYDADEVLDPENEAWHTLMIKKSL